MRLYWPTDKGGFKFVGLTFDSKEFDRSLKLLVENSSKEAFVVINKVAGDVALRAAENTPKSTKGKIIADVNRNVGGTTLLAYKLINADRRNKGKPPLWGDAMGQARKNLLKWRMQSIAFLRSGWAEAAIDLGKGYKERKVSRRNGQRLGSAKPATWHKLEAVLTYTIPTKQDQKSGPQIMAIAEDAIQKAIDFKTSDMNQKLNRVFERECSRQSAS